MTTQMTIGDIERRLRLPAPDEPGVLPALLLPTDAAAVRGAVRLRPRLAPTPNMRLAYALVALLLAAAVVAAGALRLLNSDDPLVGACDPMGPMIAEPGDPVCQELAVPNGWHQLGAGQLMQGDFTEEGLGNEIVRLVMANVPLGGCASPGGPFPTGIPVGSNEIHVPAPTPDPGLACLRAAPLPEDGIRIVTMHGVRILGLDAHGVPIPDTSEPTAAAGWTETVGDRPARLTITTQSGAGRPTETRTWDILRPGSIDGVLRITADIAGPDLEAGRAEVQRVIDDVQFKWRPPSIEESRPDEVLRLLLDGLERSARENHSDLYGCFPREPGQAEGTINGWDGGPVGEPLDVTCSSSIEPSLADVWRIVLDVTWEATSEHPGDTIRMEFFSTGERRETSSPWIDMSGGYATLVSGGAMEDQGVGGWLPGSEEVLPPPLDGPLNLPPGSVVEILWPGESPTSEPGGGDDSIYPGIVGRHLYVVAGPTVIDGEEWYQVQGGSPYSFERQWFRGTRDGRPQLKVVTPECPTGELTVGDVSWLIAAEQLGCFGSRELTFERAVLVAEPGFSECWVGDGPGPCPTATGADAWITGHPWWLYGGAGPAGPEPAFWVWLAPGVEVPAPGEPARVRGHFDDPAAVLCRSVETIGPGGFVDADPEFRSLICRERFVVTSIEP